MPQWMQVLLMLSPWILGFVGSIVFIVTPFHNEKYVDELEKKAPAFFDGLPFLAKIPVCLVLWPISQGFFMGLLFIYAFFCPEEAAIL